MNQCKLASLCSLLNRQCLLMNPNTGEAVNILFHCWLGTFWKLALYCLTGSLPACMFTREESLHQDAHYKPLLHQHEALTACSWCHHGTMLLSLSSCLLCSTLQSISNPVFRLCDGLVAMWWVESSGKLVCILINSSFLVCKTLEVYQWQH